MMKQYIDFKKMKKKYDNYFYFDFLEGKLVMYFKESVNPDAYKGFPSSKSSNIAIT